MVKIYDWVGGEQYVVYFPFVAIINRQNQNVNIEFITTDLAEWLALKYGTKFTDAWWNCHQSIHNQAFGLVNDSNLPIEIMVILKSCVAKLNEQFPEHQMFSEMYANEFVLKMNNRGVCGLAELRNRVKLATPTQIALDLKR